MLNFLILAVTCFYPFLFYFDELNFYHRNQLVFLLFTISTFTQQLFIAALIIKNRRNLPFSQFFCLLMIIVLPILAVIIQSFIYGYSLGNITSAISMLIFFIDFLHTSSLTKSDRFLVIVKDDGTGFDTDAFFSNPHSEGHIGIKNVRERLSLLCGGTLTIESQEGKGTTATISVPKSQKTCSNYSAP